MVLLEKANGLLWYFNGNHWNVCETMVYWASIVFFSREGFYMRKSIIFFILKINKQVLPRFKK